MHGRATTELPLTELSPSEYDGDVGRLLSESTSELTAFVVSFFVIALSWSSHHRIFDRLVAIDGRLLRFVTALMTRALALYVARHPELCDGPEDDASRAGTIRGVFAVVVFAVAFAASFWLGVTATWLLLLMLLEGPISGLLARRQAAT